jgi:hypothetical protein
MDSSQPWDAHLRQCNFGGLPKLLKYNFPEMLISGSAVLEDFQNYLNIIFQNGKFTIHRHL